MKRKEIIDDVTMKRAITRITYEIIERNKNLDNIVLAGIKTRGVFSQTHSRTLEAIRKFRYSRWRIGY